ncbi:tRNA(Met) cytidine acetyltransferase TmcA [Halalkalicoccus ordinarius]|uniref:tRNA(Met) cytidine acetyltransferase TmcA n=1 Tax=Halalkalicoccus ordinarius TaxID=3116651 RepID=UPI00300EAD44
MELPAVAASLLEEARATNERRLLVLSGGHETTQEAARTLLEALPIGVSETTLIGPDAFLRCEHVDPKRTVELLGRTRQAIVYDAHDALLPNALGRLTGAVDGGGLFVLLAPPLDSWPARRDGFDEGLAVPPFDLKDVTGRFRERLVGLLRVHPGIAIVDVDAGVLERDGLVHPAPRIEYGSPELPSGSGFPREAYERCLTADQIGALEALEALRENGRAVVIESDRGRGKSSAAGLAAGSLAVGGDDVLVTAPEARSTDELFSRARELLTELDALSVDESRLLETPEGGRVRFALPTALGTERPDVLLVDEAAAIPVRLLERTLSIGRVAYTTTVRGYEGTGRGFSVRFRDRLEESDLRSGTRRLSEPIRYAPGDPVEVWAFRALLLDAAPPVAELVVDADPDSVTYRRLTRDELADDERLLREAFGLLVAAHYRTEPDDLARLLDAPNVAVRALIHGGHVASVALLAREGGLPSETRRDLYDGGRIRGNMIPDLLTSQLRDEEAGVPVGHRVLRIATHDAIRSRGLGSRLLAEIRDEFADEVDWLGVGYGATPSLLAFWDGNGYSTVHLSTTRNDASGEYSAIMLSPTSETGRELHDRHAEWFAERIEGMLSDPLDDADPDVVRAALAATDVEASPDLSNRAWRHVASAAYGPGTFDTAPGSFRPVAVAGLVDGDVLDERRERLLVRKVLQGRAWDGVADELGFVSTRMCMRGLGEAFEPLVDRYGNETALAEKRRYACGDENEGRNEGDENDGGDDD